MALTVNDYEDDDFLPNVKPSLDQLKTGAEKCLMGYLLLRSSGSFYGSLGGCFNESRRNYNFELHDFRNAKNLLLEKRFIEEVDTEANKKVGEDDKLYYPKF